MTVHADEMDSVQPVAEGPEHPAKPSESVEVLFSGLRLSNSSGRRSSISIKLDGRPVWNLELLDGKQIWIGTVLRGGKATDGEEPWAHIQLFERGRESSQLNVPGVMHVQLTKTGLNPPTVKPTRITLTLDSILDPSVTLVPVGAAKRVVVDVLPVSD